MAPMERTFEPTPKSALVPQKRQWTSVHGAFPHPAAPSRRHATNSRRSTRRVAALLAVGCALVISGCSKRMGHNVEDLAMITQGPLAGQVASLDGYDVYLSELRGTWGSSHKAFNLRNTSISGGPRGIAYNPKTRAFLFTNPRKPSYLLRTDERGRELPALPLQYPDDYQHYHSEGLAYIPESAPRFGGKTLLIGVQLEPEFKCRIFVVNDQGKVEDELTLEGSLHQEWISSIAYDQNGGLWVSQGDNKIHHFDLNGQKLGDAVEIPDAQSIEGLASNAKGQVFAGDLFDGKVRVLDQDLQRLPERDSSYEIGAGMTFPLAITFRPDQHRLSVLHLGKKGFRVANTGLDLKQVSEQFVLEKDATYQSSMTWVEREGRYAVLRASSGEIWFVDEQGTTQDTLDLSAHMPIQAIDYLPSTGQFALLCGDIAQGQEIHLVERDGSESGEYELAALSGIDQAVSMASYQHAGRLTFVVAQTPEQGSSMRAFDLEGARYWDLDYRKALGIVYPANLTTVDMEIVPSLAVTDPGSSRISVFIPPEFP